MYSPFRMSTLHCILAVLILAEQWCTCSGVCHISACDALEEMKDEIAKHSSDNTGISHTESLEMQLSKLERRLRSIEQPVWTTTDIEQRWNRCCEGPCQCRPETLTLSCWRQGLGELPAPQVIPKDVRVIDLGINYFKALHKDAFQGLIHLFELDLFDNQIDYLPGPIFDSLDSLQHLRLHKNRLVELPERLFLKLVNLETLDISVNSIRHLPEGLFQGTKKLIVIHISGNSLEDLPTLIFNGLEKMEDLDLSNNVLTNLLPDVFKGLTALKRLRLQDNLVQELPKEVFSDLENLEHLSLRKNRLTFIPPTLFSNLIYLKHLDLTSNWISTLSGQEFSNLIELEELHLGQNYLETLPEGLFHRLAMLNKLFIFNNNLEGLYSEAFEGLNNLTCLFINNNLLRHIGDDIFSFVPNLHKLHMDSNKLQFIPAGSLDYIPHLVSLRLGKNPWHCDCSILYLAHWLRENKHKVWDSNPTCRGPGDLGGRVIEEMAFDELCIGQWASMTRLAPRIPNADQRDYIVHLARTPRPASKDMKDDSHSLHQAEHLKPLKSIQDIQENWMADHAKHVTRMLPGGMWVLGIFVVGPGDVFADSKAVSKIRAVLHNIKKNLTTNGYLHGNCPSSEKLALHLCSNTHRYTCKSFDTNSMGSSIRPVDWKFQAASTRWHQLDCQYDLDQVFPTRLDKQTQSLKRHLQDILAAVSDNIKQAVVMIDGELKDSSEALDSLGKKKKTKASGKNSNVGEGKTFNVSFYIPCDSNGGKNEEIQVVECCGEMNFLGNLASRVFLNQKATVEEAVEAVKQDIIRSLASRFELHWDSLIEEESGSPEERLTLHEPPRRVLVPLPSSKVTLSDYLFPGEGPSEALISLQELLDLKVEESDVQKDLEIPADPNEFYGLDTQLEGDPSEDMIPGSVDSQKILFIGLAIAAAILAISIAYQFSGFTSSKRD